MDTFDSRLDEAKGMLDKAQGSWEAWWELDDCLVDEGAVDALNRYGDFFGVVIESLLSTTCTTLYQLYDKRQDVLSVPRLLDEAADQPEAKTAPPPDVSADLSAAAPIVEKIAVLRHKLFAHRDSKLSWGDAFGQAGLQPAEVLEILSATHRILNALSQWHRGIYLVPYEVAAGDTRRLVYDLKRLEEPV